MQNVHLLEEMLVRNPGPAVHGSDAVALVQVRDGSLNATVEQFPGGQSRGAVQALVKYLRDGVKPEPLVLLTPIVITKDNLNEAERIGEMK